MTHKIRSLALAAVFSAVASYSSAQIAVTLTGVANSSVAGYTQGDSYTFTFSLNPAWTGLDSTSFWFDESIADSPLFTEISGSGLNGSYVRDTSNPGAPYANISATGGSFAIMSASDYGNSIGVTALNGMPVYVNASVDGGEPPAPTYTDFNGYFAALGTNFTPTGTLSLFEASSFNLLADFNITNIGISAIPEPSTYAALLGAGALGLVIWRRRRSLKKIAA